MVRLQLDYFTVNRALYLAQAPVTNSSMKAKGEHNHVTGNITSNYKG